MKLCSQIICCVLLFTCATCQAGHRTSKGFWFYYPCVGCVGVGNLQSDTFKVFVVGEDSAPAKGVSLIGPDGTKVEVDSDGLATVPRAWDGKVVSVRDADSREITTEKLSASDDEMPRIKASKGGDPGPDEADTPTENGGDSGPDEADTPTASTLPTCPAIQRRLLLKQAIEILKKSHDELGVTDEFKISDPDLPEDAVEECKPLNEAGDDSGSQVEEV